MLDKPSARSRESNPTTSRVLPQCGLDTVPLPVELNHATPGTISGCKGIGTPIAAGSSSHVTDVPWMTQAYHVRARTSASRIDATAGVGNPTSSAKLLIVLQSVSNPLAPAW